MKNLLLTMLLMLPAAAFGAEVQEEGKGKPTVYMVADAHFDTQWRWDVRQSIGEFIPNTLYQNFRLFETCPKYKFNFEGAVKYAWMQEYYPEEFKKVRDYVRSGQWNIAGSSWDATDPNMPSPESFIRNILYGQEFYRREFGKTSDDIMLPDCFGFGYTLPTIASHCGLSYFHTQKLEWRAKPFYENGWKIPFHFGWWEGAGGGKLLAVMDGGNYSWDPAGEDISDNEDFKYRISKYPVDGIFRYYGTRSSRYEGDRGGSPTLASMKSITRAARNPKEYNVRFASVNDFFDTYRDAEGLPSYHGELLMDVHATGCYTSVSEMKRLNRRNEQMAGAAEGISVMADWLGGMTYPHYMIDEAWKRVIWHQFHDDLTGTSIPEAYRFSYNDEYISLNQYEGIVRAGIKAIADGLDTRVKGEPVVVYNPISAVNRSAVEVEVDLAPGMKDIAVYRDGKRMKSQIVSRDGSRLTVLFESEMAPLSVCVYELRQIAGAAKSATALKVSGKVLENRVYRMELDAKGDIASLRDKRNGRELVKEGESFGLALFGDNRSYNWPAWEIIKEVMDRKPSPADEDVVISVGTNGPLKASLKVERKYGDTRFIQEYTMTDGADDERIDIVTYVDWQSEGTLLKAAFPVSYDASRATYDLGIANISRGNNTDIAYETYGHQWADITADDGSYGVTVMNDSKYGWGKPDDNTLRLTLLHTPLTKEWCSNQATQDIGEHCFTYSIAGHEGVLDPSEAASLSDALNLKKAVLKVERHSGKFGSEFSMLRTDNPSLRVKALKKAQNGDGIIVRTYELSGKGSEGHVIFPAKIRYAVEVNGVEEEKAAASFSGNMLTVKADGFEPKSYRVFLEEPAVRLEAPDCETLSLPYNELAMTSDAFSSLGHMDDDWHSLAAELVPDNILCNNVLFRMGRADTWNALCCKGGSLKLPEGTRKVAMLVASSDGDRTASFEAGVKTEVKVPYYSGLYGCYGWKDCYDSFLREGDIAYVGTHRHDSRTRNEIMTYTYMFYVEVPVAEGCTELLLPDDRHVTVFAATAVKD